jgi:hypothetical protein
MTSLSFTHTGKPTPLSEADHQKLCWQWLGLIRAFGGKAQDYAYMVPNGTQLGGSHRARAAQMANLKAQGFRPGVSDIVIACPSDDYHGAYIELKKDASAYGGPKAIKSRRAAVRPEQREWIGRMLECGYFATIAWGFDDFKKIMGLFIAGETPPPLDWDQRSCDTGPAQ